MIQKILIVTGREIAVRSIIKTCREMGITAVSVYTTADENALRAAADEAVHLGASGCLSEPEQIIAAAQRTGADAVHPAAASLAKNADFARRCAC
ncbi:MAG: hypothetical protein H6656_10140 [Ardenticatenaceae bacterium]|nr:hypothetical protein [Ardenticatenaceae bacterium]